MFGCQFWETPEIKSGTHLCLSQHAYFVQSKMLCHWFSLCSEGGMCIHLEIYSLLHGSMDGKIHTTFKFSNITGGRRFTSWLRSDSYCLFPLVWLYFHPFWTLPSDLLSSCQLTLQSSGNFNNLQHPNIFESLKLEHTLDKKLIPQAEGEKQSNQAIPEPIQIKYSGNWAWYIINFFLPQREKNATTIRLSKQLSTSLPSFLIEHSLFKVES